MIIHFSIHFSTQYGQNLFITGSIPELGNNDAAKALLMESSSFPIWEKTIEISPNKETSINYRYFVKDLDGSVFYEVGKGRSILIDPDTNRITFNDQWQGCNEITPFLSGPFSNVFFAPKKKTISRTNQCSQELVIRTTVPNMTEEETIFLCGDISELGMWKAESAAEMYSIGDSKWEIHLSTKNIYGTINYKFIIKRSDGSYLWEQCDNHLLQIPSIQEAETYCVEHSQAAFPIPTPRLVGTAIPVFALRSENGCGIGDFTDIKLMVDWAVKTGQNIIQMLPINDTTSTGTWTDSYPYGGITVMALHPIYLNLPSIGEFADKKTKAAFEKERKVLNGLNVIDYEKVLKFKIKYLKILFELYSKKTFAEASFKTFKSSNEGWLLPYCAFCTLRDKYGSADFSKWGKEDHYCAKVAKELNKKGSTTANTMAFYMFIQYQLHKQLRSSVEYAHSKRVILKGDIPIGITPQSVETWSEPYYFNMDSQAGAPPDDFSIDGQNWGFPTYNWDAIAKDGYRWWKNRFRKMSEYFDAFRIDHVLGFFRIWEIPISQVKGLMGHFYPALPYNYEEILNYGFEFNYHRHAKPYIRYYMLREMFGDDCERVMNTFLDSVEYEVFTLKPEFDTQKKIEAYFQGKEDNVKEGVMALVSEVLFIEDTRKMGLFHPRISGQNTYSYRALDQSQKDSYNALYDHFFYVRNNEFWKNQALKKLPELISATNMLTCAEDLGMIPACVPQVLDNLKVATLEIQRMPKDPKIQFADPAQYPYLSVCTTGTHDTSTLRGWWEENRAATEDYFHSILHQTGDTPQHCEPWICEKIVKMHLAGNSMLTILPLQDWFSTFAPLRVDDPSSERINVPSNPKHYWRYRMHISLESLLDNKEFNSKIIELINNSK